MFVFHPTSNRNLNVYRPDAVIIHIGHMAGTMQILIIFEQLVN